MCDFDVNWLRIVPHKALDIDKKKQQFNVVSKGKSTYCCIFRNSKYFY